MLLPLSPVRTARHRRPLDRPRSRWGSPGGIAVLALAAVVLLTGCDRGNQAEGVATPVAPTAPGDDGAAGGGDTDVAGTTVRELVVDGATRSYRLHLPPDPGDGPLPLVVVLHGGFGSGSQAEDDYGWDGIADREGVVVAYPDGLHRSWAVSDECCGPSVTDGVDEVAFLESLIDDVSTVVAVDEDRVFATGISNGGMLAHRLACDSDRFAAIGAVAATLLGGCEAPQPLSVLLIHGTADPTVPYQGGPGGLRDGTAGLVRSGPVVIDGPGLEDLAAFWAGVDGCGPLEQTGDGPVTTLSASGCPDGLAVQLVAVDGAGHQWPGAEPKPMAQRLLGLDPPSDALDATATIWAFFEAATATG